MGPLSSNELNIIAAILGAAIVTYALRLGGLLLAERMPRNLAFTSFMEALPGTILVALVAPGIVAAGWNGCAAALLTAFCAYKTRNVLLSMLVGMVVVALWRAIA